MKFKKKNSPQEEILLGIDFGETNIGIAFGRNGLISPIKTIPAKDQGNAINEIVKAALNNKVTKIVIGLPLSEKGKDTAESIKIRRFAKLLKVRLKKPVEFVDEYQTSVESLEESINNGIPQKSRRKIDHISAAIILRNYYQKDGS